MKKKTILPAKEKTRLHHLPTDPPPPTKIKETVVADPSISFTIELPEGLAHTTPGPGYYVLNFKAKIYLSDIANDPTQLIKVATVRIKRLSSRTIYLYIPFGDAGYAAGQEFDFKLKLSGISAVTLEPIQFSPDNCFYQRLIGGGIIDGPDTRTISSHGGNGKSNGQKKQ